jgi:hypothetical protein
VVRLGTGFDQEMTSRLEGALRSGWGRFFVVLRRETGP